MNLVSIIIPCFNADRWLREAIDSCLSQTYLNIEIIVIDDGSSDNSLDIIKSYDNRLIWKSIPNHGSNYARNLGFKLSTGEFIQYLDADDYILPEKIAKQVDALEITGADVVYGDWQEQLHYPDGRITFNNCVKCELDDFIEAMLKDQPIIAHNALLFSRDIIAKTNGWDLKLKAGQDRDFKISVALTGAKIIYQPGCYSIYRRYGNFSLSTSNKERWLRNHLMLMEKVEKTLIKKQLFSEKYRQALAESYFIKIVFYGNYLNQNEYIFFLRKILFLNSNFRINQLDSFTKTDSFLLYWLLQKIFGFIAAGILVRWLKLLSVSIFVNDKRSPIVK